MMVSSAARPLLTLTLLGAAAAATLDEVCATTYVQSVLPADDFIRGVSIIPDSIGANSVTSYNATGGSLWPEKSGLNFCNVTFSYSHAGLGDTIQVKFFMPSPDQFENRWLTTGGGRFSITSGEAGLANGLVYGAAAGTTDGGFGGWSAELSDVVLTANGTLNYTMLYNFGYKAIHEMTVLGKELTRRFYAVDSFYSYYQGCSEGGREGFSQVQRYGGQFDGAAIGAPAFRQAFQQTTHLFPALVELAHGYAPPPCELAQITADTIAACDALDGRADGVISRTDLCKMTHNASASVGNAYSCAAGGGGGAGGGPLARRSLRSSRHARRQMGGGGSSSSPAVEGTVSAEAAAIAADIWNGLHDSQGRRVYISPQPGSGFSDAATTYNNATGSYEVAASGIGVQYVNYLLREVASAKLDLGNVTYDDMRGWILEGMRKFQDSIETTWPDLSSFRDAGGKVVHFHGESDDSIPAASSVLYHDAVRRVMYPSLGFNESYDNLHGWYRLFLVPGAGHCGPSSAQSNGPFPREVLRSVIDWVEGGVNPTLLNATVLSGNVTDTEQKLCSFPLRPMWSGGVMDCVYDQASIDSWLVELDSILMPVY